MGSISSIHFFHGCSLFCLVLFTIGCFSISAADVIIQALAEHRTDYRHLMVVAASYVVLSFVLLTVLFHRLIIVRRCLQNMLKRLPRECVPEKVYHEIQRGWQKTAQATETLAPRQEDVKTPGWAKPGTPLFEGLNFKQAVARTPQIVEEAALQVDPGYRRPPYCALRQYMEFLMGEGLVDPGLGKVYLAGYEQARFSSQPIEPDHYIDIMRHLAGLLQNMGYTLKTSDRSTVSSHRTGSTYSVKLRTLLSLNESQRIKRASQDTDSVYDEERVRYDIYELLTRI